ncbi:MAG: type I-U CRISPR-associated protein Csx17 [Candidatus Thermoplasmatota archaeon]|nr:type I-U CRISPR-associated protein Csx17 [Candidatus Thermoplasmatota archaeon]
MIDDMNSTLDLFGSDDNKVQQTIEEKRIEHSEEDGIDNVNDITLEGCSPVPLASYLKALGVFRLVAEQKDRKVRGYWKNDRFHLVTRMTENELIDFFVKEYKPSPILSPWNGRSGFLEEDEDSNRKGAVLKKSFSDNISIRFSNIRKMIKILNEFEEINNLNNIRNHRKNVENELNIIKKIKNKTNEDLINENVLKEEKNILSNSESELKNNLLNVLRNKLPDDILSWMDSTLSLKSDIDSKPEMLPLLGSGGVDGSQDFSVNFLERICDLFSLETGNPREATNFLLINSLFNLNINSIPSTTVGQFNPNAAGGMNAQSGFEADSIMNPWDFIFLIEGTQLFLSTVTRRNNIQMNYASAPFTVKHSISGYGSSSREMKEESRAEIWMPIWSNKACFQEIKKIFSEGKSSLNGNISYSGVDFALSIASLGVDRGITEFIRYGLLKRNGKNYFAIQLGRFKVKRQPQIDLIKDINHWLSKMRQKLSSKEMPNSIKSALHKLDGLIIALCSQKSTQKIESILIELGRIEAQLNKSKRWVKDTAKIDPIPYLSKKWIDECNDGSAEYRLALSLASIYGRFGKDYISIRQNLEPIILPEEKKPFFEIENNENEIVDTKGDLIHVMNRILARRIIKAQQAGCDSYSDRAMFYCSPSDISDFLEERVNDSKIWDLFNGLVLINWKKREEIHIQKPDLRDTIYPDSVYMMMKLCYCDYEFPSGRIPLVPEIHRRCSAGDGTGAFRSSLKRLRGSGVIPAVTNASVSRRKAIRMAASLLFPVHENQIREYLNRIGRTGTYNFKE